MHVAFVGRIVPPITGSELVMVELFKELAQNPGPDRYSIFICAPDQATPEFAFPPGSIRLYGRRWRASLGSILWHQLVLPLRVAREKIDVIFVVQNRVPLIKNCRQVIILHDLAEYRVPRKYDRARDFYRKLALRLSARRAEKVVTVSESSRRDILRFLGLPAEQVAVVYNGVGDEFFLSGAPQDAALAGRYPLDQPYLLYVGAIEHPNKNLVRLVQAYALARPHFPRPHRLLLVGPRRRQPEVVFAEIERLGLQADVLWLGYVPRPDLPALYAGAAAFVYVSLWEGFGLPVLEAMAAGTPVIASNTASLPEVVGDAGWLLAKPE